MKLESKKGVIGVASHALFGVCQTCNLWEPENKYRPDMANMGYCPLFDKRTRFDHGKQCTGHSDLHSPNAKGDAPGAIEKP